MTKQWPIKSHSVDIALDIFCFTHQTDIKDVEFYKRELKRILKPSGLLVLSLASIKDTYYGTLPKVKIKKDVFKVTDPKINVRCFLYTKEGLIKEFHKNFKLLDFIETKKVGLMHGKKYKRVTLKFLFEKKS